METGGWSVPRRNEGIRSRSITNRIAAGRARRTTERENEMNANSVAVRVVSLLAVVVMTGCASGVQRSSDAARQPSYFSDSGKTARDVTIALDKNAQAQLS